MYCTAPICAKVWRSYSDLFLDDATQSSADLRSSHRSLTPHPLEKLRFGTGEAQSVGIQCSFLLHYTVMKTFLAKIENFGGGKM